MFVIVILGLALAVTATLVIFGMMFLSVAFSGPNREIDGRPHTAVGSKTANSGQTQPSADVPPSFHDVTAANSVESVPDRQFQSTGGGV
jgi:hypothetical protein